MGVMFAYTVEERWQLGIGDPTFMGWVTVFAYWMAALVCWRAARKARQAQETNAFSNRSRIFWLLSALFLVLLGINKQLDLQTWFTLFAKHLAQEQGWYEQRRWFQAIFIALVAVVGTGLMCFMAWLVKGSRDRAKLALIGGVFLGVFVLIRASSFHHVDQMLGFRLAGLKMNWIFELSGIACVALAAATGPANGPARHRPRSPSPY